MGEPAIALLFLNDIRKKGCLVIVDAANFPIIRGNFPDSQDIRFIFLGDNTVTLRTCF